MIIIAGLGNPGRKYTNTRHNIGFQIIDEFARENNFPEFKMSKKFNALISEKENIILVKPQTFMNQSGKAIKKLPETRTRAELIIVHDDIDLPLGKIRISKNRGSAGHKGVESIIKELNSKDFTRLRIGIQPKTGKPKNVEKFVLQNFTKEEKETIRTLAKAGHLAIKKLS